MDPEAAVRSIRDSRELWGAVAGASIVVTAGLLAEELRSARPIDPSLVLAAGVVTGLVAGAWSTALGASVVVSAIVVQRVSSPARTVSTAWAVGTSWAAVWAVYIGVPETKRTLALGGAVLIAGLTALAGRRGWWRSAHVVSLALAVIVIVDSAGRDGPLVAGLAVVLVHVLVTSRPASPWVVLLAWVDVVVLARVAGLSGGTARPTLLTTACLAVVVGALWIDRRSHQAA